MIRVRHLSKIYKMGKVKVQALKEVSFDIEDGEIVCIMGKSGSGKSTLLRQVGLIDKPTDGEILIDGYDVLNISESKRTQLRLKKLGYVFQDYALIPELTAIENVYLPAIMLGKNIFEAQRYSKKLLRLIGLYKRAAHRPKELSGGEQQRVAIARALVNNPSILFADEPTANLDTSSSKTVMETLLQVNKDLGVTIVFVSHDPDDKKYAKRIIYLKDGEIIKDTK